MRLGESEWMVGRWVLSVLAQDVVGSRGEGLGVVSGHLFLHVRR
jgi:hypothetical protein